MSCDQSFLVIIKMFGNDIYSIRICNPFFIFNFYIPIIFILSYFPPQGFGINCLKQKRRGVSLLVPPSEVFAIPIPEEQVTAEAHAMRLYVLVYRTIVPLMQGYNYCCTHMDIIHPEDIPSHFVLSGLKVAKFQKAKNKALKTPFTMSALDDICQVECHPMLHPPQVQALHEIYCKETNYLRNDKGNCSLLLSSI